MRCWCSFLMRAARKKNPWQSWRAFSCQRVHTLPGLRAHATRPASARSSPRPPSPFPNRATALPLLLRRSILLCKRKMELPRSVANIRDVRSQPPEKLVGLKRPVAILAVQQHRHALRYVFHQRRKGIQGHIYSTGDVPICKFLATAHIHHQQSRGIINIFIGFLRG